MGLDVYVGSLTRYYSGQWETIIQQMAPELGMTVDMRRPAPPSGAIEDPMVIQEAVIGWRIVLAKKLHKQAKDGLDWNESVAAPYFTDKPAWDCYAALVMWAAGLDDPGLRLPDVVPERFSESDAFRRAGRNKKGVLSQLATGTELWLPVELKSVERIETVAGRRVLAGSSVVLLKQLQDVNARSWHADQSTVDRWRHDGAQYGGPLEVSARFAFSVFLRLTEEAVRNRLPMMLDY